jgi:hypothetical protein
VTKDGHAKCQSNKHQSLPHQFQGNMHTSRTFPGHCYREPITSPHSTLHFATLKVLIVREPPLLPIPFSPIPVCVRYLKRCCLFGLLLLNRPGSKEWHMPLFSPYIVLFFCSGNASSKAFRALLGTVQKDMIPAPLNVLMVVMNMRSI